VRRKGDENVENCFGVADRDFDCGGMQSVAKERRTEMTLDEQNELYAEAKAVQYWLNEINNSQKLKDTDQQLLNDSIYHLHYLAEKILEVEINLETQNEA